MGLRRAMMIGLDGADPMMVKNLIAEGRLPNLEKLLKRGIATNNLDMLGVLPTITPPNWATLATGNYPRTHGITCFLNHTLGKTLGITELNWDSRRIESEVIWEAFEDEGKKCIMLNYCEAWPNRKEGSNNIFIDGTGVVPFLRTSVGFQKLVYMKDDYPSIKEVSHVVNQSSGDCVVYGDQVEEFAKKDGMTKEDLLASMSGNFFKNDDRTCVKPPLESTAFVMYDFSAEEAANADTIDRLYTPIKAAKGWQFSIPENALEVAVDFNGALTRRYLLITASNGKDYDTYTLYVNKKINTPLGSAKVGEWSQPVYDVFNIHEQDTKVAYYFRGIHLEPNGAEGKLYISHVMDLEDKSYYYPQHIQEEMLKDIGPMCYFAAFDRHTPEGDEIALESFKMLHDWHIRATQWLFEKNPDWQLFYIHLHSIDLFNHWYIEQSLEGTHPDWKRHAELIKRIYEVNDAYVGAMLEYLDDDTTIFVCSDHAAIPRSVGYENPGIGELSGISAKLMSELGYTVVNPIPNMEGMYAIDWSKTRAVNHRTSYIYINLKGRDPEGIVEQEDYERLVQQIISDLYNYRDPKTGERVIAFAMTREEMESIGMGGEHCGDIFFQLTRNFGFEHGNSLQNVTNHGYSLGCLCIMAGAGLKSGEVLYRPVRNVDIVPTICHIVSNRMPKNVEGGIIYQALKD